MINRKYIIIMTSRFASKVIQIDNCQSTTVVLFVLRVLVLNLESFDDVEHVQVHALTQQILLLMRERRVQLIILSETHKALVILK